MSNPARDREDPDTVSVFEVGSVKFLESLARLPHWEEVGVPVSGDKTATFYVRGHDGPVRELP